MKVENSHSDNIKVLSKTEVIMNASNICLYHSFFTFLGTHHGLKILVIVGTMAAPTGKSKPYYVLCFGVQICIYFPPPSF